MPDRQQTRAALVLLVALWALPAGGQQTGAGAAGAAGAVQQSNQATRQYQRQQRELSQKPQANAGTVTNQASTPKAAPAAAGPTFLLRQVTTGPSAVLTRAQLAAVTSRYVNRRVSISDLQAMVAALNRLYQERGVLTARAVLPPQRVVNGVVHLQLIEARVDRVLVEGAQHTRPSFVRGRIGLKPGDLVSLPVLRQHLLELNAENNLATRAELRPGGRFGTTDVVVVVNDAAGPQLMPGYDNLGRGSVGLRRLGLDFADPSLFGVRDELSLSASWAAGTWSEAGSYSLPLGTSGLRLVLGGNYGSIRIISGALKSLHVTGNSYEAQAGLLLPVVVRPHLQISESANVDLMRSATESGGHGISDQVVRAADMGVSLRAFDAEGAWLASNTVSFGKQLHQPAVFGRDTLAVTREEILGGGFRGLIRFSGQARLPGLAPALPLLEQLQLGGLATVRGYPQGWEIGDTGYALTNELDYPLPLRRYFFGGAFSRGLEGALFFDHGGLFGLPGNHSGPKAQPRDIYLTSAGVGVIFNTPFLTGRLDWGVPLENRQGLPRVGFDFFLQPQLNWGWMRAIGL